MKVSKETFGSNGALLAHPPGVFGVQWITRSPCCSPLSGYSLHAQFLRIVDSMTATLPDGDQYLYGTTYYRVLAAAEPAAAGRWHYDTGLDHPAPVRNAGVPVLRFTATLSTGSTSVANLFTRNHQLVGLTADDPAVEAAGDVTQPDNGRVVMFSEGVDLHARPARPAGLGRLAFYSATLYTPRQTPDLSCHALIALRTGEEPS